MKMKELKNLAKKIAKCEQVIRNSDDEDAVHRAEEEVIKLSGSVKSLEDIMIIDELVQELLSENS